MVTMLRMATVSTLANVFTLVTIATVFTLANVLRMITVFTIGTLTTHDQNVHPCHVFTLGTCSLLPPLPHMITLVKCVSQKTCVTNLTNNKHHATAANHPKEPISSFLHHRHTRTTNKQTSSVCGGGQKRIKTA